MSLTVGKAAQKMELEFTNPSELVGKPFAEWQKTAILETLKLTDGRRDKAAKMLKIPLRTFYRRLSELGIRKWPDPIPREARARGLPW